MGKLVFFCAGISNNRYPVTNMQGVLINSATHGENKRCILNTLKMLKKFKYQYIILDSGGYQLIVAEQKGNLKKSGILDWLTPEHVMSTAAQFKPDIVMALDYPILDISDPEEQDREFAKKIFTNLKWARESIELKSLHCPESQLFLPVQAYNMKQMNLFFTRLDSTEFDGVSLPIRNASPQQIIQQFLFLQNIGIRKVHILGTSKFSSIIISAFMARHYFDWVSLDATTWGQHAQYGFYMHPDNLTAIKLKHGKKYPEINCSCPWCQYQNIYNLINLPNSDFFSIVLNHNHFAIENICTQAFDHSGSIDELQKFSTPRIPDKLSKESENLFKALRLFEILASEKEGYKKIAAVFG